MITYQIKPCLNVLIGGWTSGVIESISEYLKEKTKNRYYLKIIFASIDKEILSIANADIVDIYIIDMNDINYPIVSDVEVRLKDSISLMNQIKNLSRNPLIALSGWHGPPFEETAKEASSFYFRKPVELTMIGTAFERCIELLDKKDK